MTRNIKRYSVPGDKNSLQYWTQYVSSWRVVLNFLIIYTCRLLPSLKMKNYLYRLIGIKVGKNVSVGLMAMFDIFFPELITLEDDVIIGYNAVLLAHEFMRDYWATGEVIIGRGSVIGANVTILAGVKIEEHVVVGAGGLVNTSLPANILAVGVPAREKREGGNGE